MIPPRPTNLWKPAWIALVLIAATLYAVLVGHELSRRARMGAERRARAEAARGFEDDQALLGTIWAHRRHPYDATWCPDYSPSFHEGCADAVAGDLAKKAAHPP
jgi:hypothetical protein